MGKLYYVDISRQLLADMLTKGWHMEEVECIEGLPEGSVLVDTARHREDIISFLFHSPEGDPFDLPAEHIDVMFRKQPKEERVIYLPNEISKRGIIVLHRDGAILSNFPGAYSQVDVLGSDKLEYEVEELT